MPTSKITQAEIIKVLGLESAERDAISLSSGKFTLRRGFYWGAGIDATAAFKKTEDKLKAAGYQLANVEHGRKDAPFRGGESVKKNSHIWMTFKVSRSNVPV